MSSALSDAAKKDIVEGLFYRRNFLDLGPGNDRPDVSLVVRPMHQKVSTFRDLAFLVPKNTSDPSKIDKCLVYTDDVYEANVITDYLEGRCHKELQSLCRQDGNFDDRVIRPYGAFMSKGYQQRVMEFFRQGRTRILICCYADRMGTDILDVDVVVQWRLPSSVSSFVQRAGMAARGPGRTGLAVLIVERPVYEADVIKYMADLEGRKNASRFHPNRKEKEEQRERWVSEYPKAYVPEQYAKERGAFRGSFDGAMDDEIIRIEVPLDLDSADEGLYGLVQAGICRRKPLRKIYSAMFVAPAVPCCDICCPDLFDMTRPGPPRGIERGEPNFDVMDELEEWREEAYERDWNDSAMATSSDFLGDDLVELLASVGPIEKRGMLDELLEKRWSLYETYCAELWSVIKELDIPPMMPKE